MTSGGTRPSTRSITKNGAPRGPGSSSSHRTRGTGSPVRSAASRIVRYCRGMSYSGKIVYADGSAASLNAHARTGGSGCSMSKSRVSLDMPLDSGTLTFTASAPGRRTASHGVSLRATSSGSRVLVRGRGAVAIAGSFQGATES